MEMRRIAKCLLLIVVVTIGGRCFGQEPVKNRRNALKIDVLGIYYPIYSALNSANLRFSGEFQRTIRDSKHISFHIDLEYRNKYYEFVRFFEWPSNNPPIEPRFLDGRTHQNDLSLILGIRFCGYFGSDVKRVNWFIDPRTAIVWRHAKLYPSDVGLPVVFLNEFGISPRLRSGIGMRLTNRLELEASAEILNQKYIGNGNRKWQFWPELNLCFQF